MSILVGTVQGVVQPPQLIRVRVAPAPDHPQREADKELSTVVHVNVSVGGRGKQPGKARLLRGEVDTCDIRHAGVRPLLVGSKTSLNITLMITKLQG